MTLTITQRTAHRPGRAAHWIELQLACPHGSHGCEADIPAADRLPLAVLARVSAHAVRHLIHHVMSHHRRATGCSCAEPLGIFCWPDWSSAYVISRDSLSLGGTRHVATR
jgi:hypothetical protein